MKIEIYKDMQDGKNVHWRGWRKRKKAEREELFFESVW